MKTSKTPLAHATRKPPPSRPETCASGDFELSGCENSENTTPARHPHASPFQARHARELRKHHSRTPPASLPLPGQSRAKVVILSLLAVKTPKTPLPHATRKPLPSRPETAPARHPQASPFQATRAKGDFEFSGHENSENTTPARHPQASPFQGRNARQS